MVSGALAIFGFIIGMIWFWAWLFSCLFESKSDKKNTNADDNKKSRSIFAETIHQVCQQNGYYE